MPYLAEKDRLYYDALLIQLEKHSITTPGELNFLLTKLCLHAIKDKTVNYTLLNGIVGALESCKLELYARLVRPYESEKIKQNGDVFPCQD